MQTVFRGLGVSANSTRTSKLQWDAGDAGPGTVLWLLPRLLGVASIERLGWPSHVGRSHPAEDPVYGMG